jgi:hypothetical protein
MKRPATTAWPAEYAISISTDWTTQHAIVYHLWKGGRCHLMQGKVLPVLDAVAGRLLCPNGFPMPHVQAFGLWILWQHVWSKRILHGSSTFGQSKRPATASRTGKTLPCMRWQRPPFQRWYGTCTSSRPQPSRSTWFNISGFYILSIHFYWIGISIGYVVYWWGVASRRIWHCSG